MLSISKISPETKRIVIRKRLAFIKPPRAHNEDWNRMVWATFKPFLLLFAFLTIILLTANLLYYQHKWSTPQKKQFCDSKDCLKKKTSNETLEILTILFQNHSLKPLVHQISMVGLLCTAAIFGNFLNDFTLSYFSAYGMSVVWIHEHYHNFRVIFDSSAICYNLGHFTLILAAMSSFAFAASVADKKHRIIEEQKEQNNNRE